MTEPPQEERSTGVLQSFQSPPGGDQQGYRGFSTPVIMDNRQGQRNYNPKNRNIIRTSHDDPRNYEQDCTHNIAFDGARGFNRNDSRNFNQNREEYQNYNTGDQRQFQNRDKVQFQNRQFRSPRFPQRYPSQQYTDETARLTDGQISPGRPPSVPPFNPDGKIMQMPGRSQSINSGAMLLMMHPQMGPLQHQLNQPVMPPNPNILFSHEAHPGPTPIMQQGIPPPPQSMQLPPQAIPPPNFRPGIPPINQNLLPAPPPPPGYHSGIPPPAPQFFPTNQPQGAPVDKIPTPQQTQPLPILPQRPIMKVPSRSHSYRPYKFTPNFVNSIQADATRAEVAYITEVIDQDPNCNKKIINLIQRQEELHKAYATTFKKTAEVSAASLGILANSPLNSQSFAYSMLKKSDLQGKQSMAEIMSYRVQNKLAILYPDEIPESLWSLPSSSEAIPDWRGSK